MDNAILGFKDEYRWLSNFYPCPITYDFINYSCVEVAYCAAKCELLSERDMFYGLNGAQAKSLGKRIQLKSNWEEIKVNTMHRLLKQKFNQEPFRTLLIETYPMHIEETNHWGDTYWGVCKGKGENRLGILIMDIRDRLRVSS
jgi:ribA/ribD-fused uncharacterized protein